MPGPGPPLQKEFTYNGTPGNPPRSEPYNRLSREMIQTQRFYNSADTGTHSRKGLYSNIPNNSGQGRGLSGGGIVAIDHSIR
jgi:hypothetical protein